LLLTGVNVSIHRLWGPLKKIRWHPTSCFADTPGWPRESSSHHRRVFGKSRAQGLLFSTLWQSADALTLDHQTTNVLAPYVRSLLEGLPPSSKLPLYDYGTAGGLGYFKAKLMDIMSYPDLKTEVFYHLKEFGNTVAFLSNLDIALAQASTKTFVQAAPFLGIRTDNYQESLNSAAVASAPLYVAAHGVLGALSTNGLAKTPHIIQDLVVSIWKAG
jgi:hypothetical protein